jgi:PKD repeat protein
VPPSIGGSFSAQPDQAVVFDVAAGDTAARFAWDLGDGTVRSGASATHTYRRAGIYPVVVTAEMPDGSLTTSTAVARIGVAANEAPSVSVRPVTVSSPGASVAFTGAVSDADGKVLRTFWNFGDGEFGEGLTVAHTYAEPGTYTVTFSATADEGAWTSAETIVAVGTPPAPTPLAPTGNVPAGVVTLSWSAVPQAAGYRAVAPDGSSATVFSVEVEATAACSGRHARSVHVGTRHESMPGWCPDATRPVTGCAGDTLHRREA